MEDFEESTLNRRKRERKERVELEHKMDSNAPHLPSHGSDYDISSVNYNTQLSEHRYWVW